MKTNVKNSDNKGVTTNVVETKKVVDLNNPTTKANFIEAKKEAIKKGIDFNNLDFANLLNQSQSIKVEKQNSVNEKHFIYKFEREDLSKQKAQSKRNQIRKKIEKLNDNVIYYFQNKNVVELEKSVELFKIFYLETYILNDYSLNSVYANHVEQIKKDKLKLVFDIIQLM
jgi:hypothetical protein